jgi:hypothetical protein
MPESTAAVAAEVVNATIEHFTALDQAGDKSTMTKLAQRLGKEQPALLAHAAKVKTEHGDALGEAAIFYSTLVWAMFDRGFGKKLTRLLPANLTDAEAIVSAELPAGDERPTHERVAPSVAERQPHVMAKLQELIAEDVKEAAIEAEGSKIIFALAQVVAEAFDAAASNRRPGQTLNPIVRDEPKVGRNDPCPCGSGKKWKRCHGAAAA